MQLFLGSNSGLDLSKLIGGAGALNFGGNSAGGLNLAAIPGMPQLTRAQGCYYIKITYIFEFKSNSSHLNLDCNFHTSLLIKTNKKRKRKLCPDNQR